MWLKPPRCRGCRFGMQLEDSRLRHLRRPTTRHRRAIAPGPEWLHHLGPVLVQVGHGRRFGQRHPQGNHISHRPALKLPLESSHEPGMEVLRLRPAKAYGRVYLRHHGGDPSGPHGEEMQRSADVPHMQSSRASFRLQPIPSQEGGHRSQFALWCRFRQQLQACLTQESGREPIEVCQDFLMRRGRELHEGVQALPLTNVTIWTPCGPHLPRMDSENAPLWGTPTTTGDRLATCTARPATALFATSSASLGHQRAQAVLEKLCLSHRKNYTESRCIPCPHSQTTG